MQATKLKVADIELELLDTGKGAPLFFLHGGGGFDPGQPFVPRLSEKHRLIAPSHPGFGNSSLPDWLDSVDDIAHLYLELLDKLGVEQADFVGCSIGGWIAAEMATKAPQRVRRLVMVSPVGVKLGPSDKLDIPDIFAMPQADVQKLMLPRSGQDGVRPSEDDRRPIVGHVPQPRDAWRSWCGSRGCTTRSSGTACIG